MPSTRTIYRIWHGWTSVERADAFEAVLRSEILPDIAARNIDGLRGVRLLRHPVEGEEVAFMAILQFDSWEAIRDFAGGDIEAPYLPEPARSMLTRSDARVRHYVQCTRMDL
ncbi:MAG: antibiotic biosynthesis monooxygenase [Alphaproteobacteria bacterium]